MPSIFINPPWGRRAREEMITQLLRKISDECFVYLQNNALGLTQAQIKINVENKIRETVTQWQDDILSKYKTLDAYTIATIRGVGFEFSFSTMERNTANMGMTDGSWAFIKGSLR